MGDAVMLRLCLIAALGLALVCSALSADSNAIVPEEPFNEKGIAIGHECSMNVNDCFVPLQHEEFPKFREPVSYYQDSYASMCAPEKHAKIGAMEKKRKSEGKTKELCNKSEVNKKRMEKEVKLTEKKEASGKKVHESKEKYLNKKLANAQEVSIKATNDDKEASSKSAEKSNKEEDKLYKIECKAKESAFKSIREGRQKMHVVYITNTPIVAKKKNNKQKTKKVVVKKSKKVNRHKPTVPKPKPHKAKP